MSEILENFKSHPEFKERKQTLPIHDVLIGHRVIEQIPDTLKRIGMDGKLLVVSDRYTYEAAGKQVEAQLKKAGCDIQSAVFGETYLKPTDDALEKLKKAFDAIDGCVAVGAGTINDLCKYISYINDKPYVVVSTAPSMNGYASANASLIIKGHRTSKAAQLPKAIFMDMEIIEKAPRRLIRSGIGDMLCRSTVQSDWLLSHYLLETTYCKLPFAILAEEEAILLENAADIVQGDEEGLAALCAALIKSGLAMWYCDGSYPASQAEHMVAHVMEMAFPVASAKSYHGEQIAVTTLAIAQIQEELLQKPFPLSAKIMWDDEALSRHLKQEVVAECEASWQQKRALIKQKQEEWSLSRWEAMAEAVFEIQEPRGNLHEALKSAGLALTPGTLGWTSNQFQWALQVAHLTRDRFTFLDLV